ncbi:DUF4097 domain-containing protein [Rothia halotolerans]|uniref:DUF4097 domain-containing protein n=1 Tax=Rothia halotolerans TaxID=405770 RepID=UPI001EDE73D9|nr:DUF4097 domain-containing protein [Rothia halotolerans]
MSTPDHENQPGRPGRREGAEGQDGYEYPGETQRPDEAGEASEGAVEAGRGAGYVPGSGTGAAPGGGAPAGGAAGPDGASGPADSGAPSGRHREEVPWDQPQARRPSPEPRSPLLPRRTGYGVVIGVLTAVVGGIALIGSGGSEAWAAFGAVNREDTVETADAGGLTDLDVDAEAASMTVAFGDVDHAVLEVRNGARNGWWMEREGGELSVGKRGDWCIMWCHREQEDAVLTLPRELDDGSLNAELSLDSGELRADGSFAGLETSVDAGVLTVTGSARTLDAGIEAGRADLDLSGVEEGRFDVSAGRIDAELTGDAPSSVEFDVSAGALDLTLPDEPYRVAVGRSAGSLDNQLDSGGSTAAATVSGELSAGDVTLRPGR